MADRILDAEFSLLAGDFFGNFKSEQIQPLDLVSHAIAGRFDEVFKIPLVIDFLRPPSTTQESIFKSIPLNLVGIDDVATRELVSLAIGVTCLHAFLQENWTGPSLETEPFSLLGLTETESYSPKSLNVSAVGELAYGGEPAYHLAKKAAFLRFAQLIFNLPYDHVITAPWWRMRTMCVHQEILDEPVGLPKEFFVPVETLLSRMEGDFAGRLLLEEGLIHHVLRNDRTAAQLFVRAAKAFGLEYELTGALGKKTKFQQNELSQLVLLAQSRERGEKDSAARSIDSSETPSSVPALPVTLDLNDDTLLEHTEFTSSISASSNGKLSHIDPGNQPALHPLDQSVLLSLCLNVRNTQPEHGLTTEQMTPYVSRVISHPRNWSVHTMALLLRSRLESTRSRTVERSTLQLQALIDQMPTADSEASERLLYIHEIPLPSTWEMERELAIRYLSLGVVRSAMEIFERLEMWEEVVKCWQSLERPDEGIKIVRDLLEGRKAEVDTVLARGKLAEDQTKAAVRRQRFDTTREAKLWCLLGDLEPHACEEHYTKAWEISSHTSGRAARSIGGFNVARNQWKEAIPWLRLAVSINPLQSRTWFLLGCACVREERWIDARDAFARCVSIDEDDGESWNNLASVYLRMKISGIAHTETKGSLDDDGHTVGNGTETALDPTAIERIPIENKILAFRALKQGLKFSYENWRMWQNYTLVCMDLGELAEACRALSRVVEELSDKEGADSVDLDVLDHLVEAVVNPPARPESLSNFDEAVSLAGTAMKANEGRGLFPRVADLFNRTILPRISSSPRIFRAYGKLLVWQGDRWGDAVDAYMSAYRCSVVDDPAVETDLERWRAAVDEVKEIVTGVLEKLGPKVNSVSDRSSGGGAAIDPERPEGTDTFKWQFQARSVLRSFMARTKETFGDEPEWGDLVDALADLKTK